MTNFLHTGASAELTRTFTEEDVNFFSQVSGDTNPLHLDESYAKTSVFGSRVVHGALINAMFSNILGNTLPGEGSIYCKQDSSFVKPVFIGETIHANVVVREIIESKNRVILDTIATNDKGETVVKGSALVLYPWLNKGGSDNGTRD